MSYTTGRQGNSGHNQYEYEYPVMTHNGQLNWWYVYMHFLRRTKILFTASGGPYDRASGGDRREGEALTSGALVFMGKSTIMDAMPHPFVHGKHLFYFDMDDANSMAESIALAKSFLAKEKEGERKAIAEACWKHACEYHRSRNYVDYAMEIIEEHLNS